MLFERMALIKVSFYDANASVIYFPLAFNG